MTRTGSCSIHLPRRLYNETEVITVQNIWLKATVRALIMLVGLLLILLIFSGPSVLTDTVLMSALAFGAIITFIINVSQNRS